MIATAMLMKGIVWSTLMMLGERLFVIIRLFGIQETEMH